MWLQHRLPHQLVQGHDAEDSRLPHTALNIVVSLENCIQGYSIIEYVLTFNSPGMISARCTSTLSGACFTTSFVSIFMAAWTLHS